MHIWNINTLNWLFNYLTLTRTIYKFQYFNINSFFDIVFVILLNYEKYKHIKRNKIEKQMDITLINIINYVDKLLILY